jgi:DNA modification methylase
VKLLPTFAQRGDIAPLLNKIHHCDALALLRRLPSQSIDMILTSPPYDNLRTYKGFTWDFESIAKESFRVLKQGGVLVWVVGDATVNGSETLTSFRQALYFVDACGFRMHDTMIFAKNGKEPNIHHPRYLQSFEYMLVLSKGEVKTFNALVEANKLAGKKHGGHTKTQKNGAKGHWGSATKYAEVSKRNNIWLYNTGNATSDDDIAFEHPAPYPETLAHDHIFSWSQPGDIVLDYFSGSGTTAKMARNMGRQFIGCDISEEYVSLARLRLSNTDPFQNSVFKDGSVQLSLFAS